MVRFWRCSDSADPGAMDKQDALCRQREPNIGHTPKVVVSECCGPRHHLIEGPGARAPGPSRFAKSTDRYIGLGVMSGVYALKRT